LSAVNSRSHSGVSGKLGCRNVLRKRYKCQMGENAAERAKTGVYYGLLLEAASSDRALRPRGCSGVH